MAQMRYPYTLGAMIAQFPLKFHIQKSWVWKVCNKLKLEYVDEMSCQIS